jgi:hypothetical protein
MKAYADYFAGALQDYELDESSLQRSLEALPQV